jgi:hypothetical protein
MALKGRIKCLESLLQKYLFKMSNKIKNIFRVKSLFIENNVQEYNFFHIVNKSRAFSLVLPENVSLKSGYWVNTIKISVDNRKARLRKRLKKQLGFFSNFLKYNLILNKTYIIRRIFLIGTGFKVFKGQLKRDLIFKIGLSHLVKITVPINIGFNVLKFSEIKFYSLDKELLGSFLNFVASIRFPDAYKGRGLLLSSKPKVKFKRGKVKG